MNFNIAPLQFIRVTAINIQLELPDNVARAMRAAGLLTPQIIQSLLADEMRRRRLDAHLDRVTQTPGEPMELSEISQEVHASRREKRKGAVGDAGRP